MLFQTRATPLEKERTCIDIISRRFINIGARPACSPGNLSLMCLLMRGTALLDPFQKEFADLGASSPNVQLVLKQIRFTIESGYEAIYWKCFTNENKSNAVQHSILISLQILTRKKSIFILCIYLFYRNLQLYQLHTVCKYERVV